MRYWLSIGDGRTQGPYTVEDLLRFQAEGRLGAEPQLCAEGSQQWVPASSVLGATRFPSHPPTTPFTAAAAMPALDTYATFGARFAAAFLDGILVYVGGAIAGAIVGAMAASARMPGDTIQVLAGVVGFALGVAYYVSFEASSLQATPGKLALGIKVTNLEGGRVSTGQALGRYFGKILSGCLLCIGYLMMLWNPRKQTLHDQLAGTLVVKK